MTESQMRKLIKPTYTYNINIDLFKRATLLFCNLIQHVHKLEAVILSHRRYTSLLTTSRRAHAKRFNLALITPGSTLMRRAAVRPSTRAINHPTVGFVYLIGRAKREAGESSPISPPQIQPAPALSSFCQRV